MKILNFGSLNVDFTYRVDHIVGPGETISSKKLEVFPGGKGLNQSIALARAGAKVWHGGIIGRDGEFLKEICRDSGVHEEYIKEADTRTGNAVIQVSETGQNCILLFSGANRELTESYIDGVLEHFEAGDLLLLQNEVNKLDYLIRRGAEKGMFIALNPSPYDEQVETCGLQQVDLFFVNEIEATQMAGEDSEEAMLAKMRALYPRAGIVLTLGDKGAYYSDDSETCFQKAAKAAAVDTTAAGDTFTGYFLASYIREKSGKEALRRGTLAAALAVERPGAAVSIPRKEEVDRKMAEAKWPRSARL